MTSENSLMNSCNCPVCGGSLRYLTKLVFNADQRLIIFNGKARRLYPQQAIVFGALYRRFGRPVQIDHLIRLVWDLEEPKNPTGFIGTLVCQLRPVLAGSGYYIPTAQYGRGYESGSYTLCFDTSKKEAAP